MSKCFNYLLCAVVYEKSPRTVFAGFFIRFDYLFVLESAVDVKTCKFKVCLGKVSELLVKTDSLTEV